MERNEKYWKNGLQNNYTYILSAENREKQSSISFHKAVT